MAYDADKDLVLRNVGETKLEGGRGLSVDVRSYDMGDPKICVARTFTKKDGSTGSQSIFRMSQEEWDGLMDLIDEVEYPFDLEDEE
jgi:hypothetical protein